MAFIEKDSNVVINVKLTTIGRKMLASGALNFSSWVAGDSEIDYNFAENSGININNVDILRPKDKNPNIKYPILPTSNATSQYNTIGTIIPVQTYVTNTAKERGFFTGNTTSGFTAQTSSTYVIQDGIKIFLSGVTGSTTVSIKQDTGYSAKNNIVQGDYLLVNWTNPLLSAATVNGVINKNIPSPFLWYKIQSLTGSLSANTLTVTLDRAVPNMGSYSGSVSSKCYIYPSGNSIDEFYGSGSTTPYWNDNTLSFNSNCNISNDDVPVWNMSIVYTEEIAGKQTGYESYLNFATSGYTGFKNYIGDTYDNKSQKAIGIIHYTNNSISNYYGEEFYSSTPVLELPTVIWYNSTGNTMGLTLVCATGTTSLGVNPRTTIPGSGATDLNTTYYDLIAVDNDSTIVGKVFNSLKMIVIENEELLAAMSYKSNRNWTYPPLNIESTGAGTSSNPNVFSTVNQKLYVTYMFANTSGYTSNVSYGYKNALHNTIYTEYTPQLTNSSTLSNSNVVRFSIDSTRLNFISDTSEFSTGTGFTFNKFYLIYQLVSSQSSRPDPTAWKIYDYTSSLNGYSTWSSTCIPASAFTGQIYSINNNIITGGTSYDLNNYLTIPTTSQPTYLQFGDEVFFFGNLKTSIAATVYRTKFLANLPFNQFNTSQNPTWDSTTQSVYVNEIGIYDSSQNMVAIGKLSLPVEKKSSQVRIFELDLDF